MNRIQRVGNAIAVLHRNVENKEMLVAGEDFFYADAVSLSKMFIDKEWYWFTIKRSPRYVVVRKDHNGKEIRLSRFLTDVKEGHSRVVKFANNHFYDLRLKNLLVVPPGRGRLIEEKRKVALSELEELPKVIKNDLVEQNGRSELQGSSTGNVLKMNRTVKLELEIGKGIKLEYCPSSIEEEQKAKEAMQFLTDKFTVVLP